MTGLKKGMKTLKIVLIAVILLAMAVPQSVQAGALQAADKKVSLVIDYKSDGVPISDGLFFIYKVADLTQDGDLAVLEEFQNYANDLSDLNGEKQQELADSMAAFCEANEIEPWDQGITSENGFLSLPSSRPMTTGLYLVAGESVEIGKNMYIPKPCLVLFPMEEENGQLSYDLVVKPKAEVKTKTSEIHVVKIWEDEGYEKKRPSQIEVQLYRGDTLVDTVTLAQNNNWKYDWSDLEEAYDWYVEEVVVSDDYEVSMENQKFTYYITNTYVGEKHPGDGSDETLPQTGVLWWPVPIMALCGIFSFFVGWIMRQKREA